MKPHIVAFIFARGGSKGVPRKNIRLLAGKPLIAYAIEVGLASTLIDRLIVSTDDDEIAAIARQYGAEVPFMRPAELAQDDSPEWLSWQHAIRTINEESPQPLDVFVSIPSTAPLRQVDDVDHCILKLLYTDADLVITATPASSNPYFNMIVKDSEDNAQLAMSDGRQVTRRQAAPTMYNITSVAYAGRPSFILQANGLFEGKVKAVVVPLERALDIDTEWDLHVAELVMQHLRTSPSEG